MIKCKHTFVKINHILSLQPICASSVYITIDSECIRGEGIEFHFNEPSCNPFESSLCEHNYFNKININTFDKCVYATMTLLFFQRNFYNCTEKTVKFLSVESAIIFATDSMASLQTWHLGGRWCEGAEPGHVFYHRVANKFWVPSHLSRSQHVQMSIYFYYDSIHIHQKLLSRSLSHKMCFS